METDSIRESEEGIRVTLKKLAKTFPKFAAEHPEIYRQWGLERVAKKAKEEYVPR